MKKKMANIITISRILCSVCMLFCPVFSFCFYVMYLFSGFTDMVDEAIARKTKSASEFGARLDTAADIIFAAVCFVKILPRIQFPSWLWIWILAIAVIKTENAVREWIRNRKLVSIHSVLNKTTGFLLFLFPLTLNIIAPVYSAAAVCSLATVSAISEAYFTRKGQEIF